MFVVVDIVDDEVVDVEVVFIERDMDTVRLWCGFDRTSGAPSGGR